MHVAVVGAGNIGTTFAALHQEAGHKVRLIEIFRERVVVINEGRLWVVMPEGSKKSECPNFLLSS